MNHLCHTVDDCPAAHNCTPDPISGNTRCVPICPHPGEAYDTKNKVCIPSKFTGTQKCSSYHSQGSDMGDIYCQKQCVEWEKSNPDVVAYCEYYGCTDDDNLCSKFYFDVTK